MGETRPRPAPARWTLLDRAGVAHDYEVSELTVLVAVKARCDGCRPFYASASDEALGPRVVVVVRDELAHRDFDDAGRPVWSAPDLLDALEVRWPPFFVVVAPHPSRVVAEGVAFSPDQVATEMSAFLARDSATGQWLIREGTP